MHRAQLRKEAARRTLLESGFSPVREAADNDHDQTGRYLHHKSRADDAHLLSAAFRPKKRKPATGRSTAAKERGPRKRAAA